MPFYLAFIRNSIIRRSEIVRRWDDALTRVGRWSGTELIRRKIRPVCRLRIQVGEKNVLVFNSRHFTKCDLAIVVSGYLDLFHESSFPVRPRVIARAIKEVNVAMPGDWQQLQSQCVLSESDCAPYQAKLSCGDWLPHP